MKEAVKELHYRPFIELTEAEKRSIRNQFRLADGTPIADSLLEWALWLRKTVRKWFVFKVYRWRYLIFH